MEPKRVDSSASRRAGDSSVTPTSAAPSPARPVSNTEYDVPWKSYSDSERLHILEVLRRDVELRRMELERIRYSGLA